MWRAGPSFNSRPSAAPAGRGGFSLIEMLGVLVILGLVASLSYVSWESMVPRSQLNTAVRELQATIYETRSDAVARSARFTVQYAFEAEDGHPRGFRVVTPFRNSPEGGFAGRDDQRLALRWHTLPDSVRFKTIMVDGTEHTRGLVEVRFEPSGASNDHYVVLEQSPGKHSFTIEVLALTGMIRMHAGDFRRTYPRDEDFR